MDVSRHNNALSTIECFLLLIQRTLITYQKYFEPWYEDFKQSYQDFFSWSSLMDKNLSPSVQLVVKLHLIPLFEILSPLALNQKQAPLQQPLLLWAL